MRVPEAGQARVVRWHGYALTVGSALACLGTGLVLYGQTSRGMRTTGWWFAGFGGGLLTMAFAFPANALTEDASS